VRFVLDVLAAVRQHGLTQGIYIGCGNGPNLIQSVARPVRARCLQESDRFAVRVTTRRAGQLIVGDPQRLACRAVIL
jgi:hypothetical protein